MPSAPASLYEGFVEPALRTHADESVFGPDHSEFRMLRPKRFSDLGLALRPARLSDGDALQAYVRGLSPQSRYNRFLGAGSELSASELARALAADGRDALTLLLTSRGEGRETVVGEARVALWRPERAGEFSLSIADDWRRLGLGSALLREIERKAAAAGIELLFGDVLRTNEQMIGLARRHGFRLGPGLEGRLVRIRKRLEDAAPDLPCRNWNEIAARAELRTA
jgi:GNAT superfamily N-acetyltransferase